MTIKYFSLSTKKLPKSFSPKKKPSSFLKTLRNYGFSMEKAPSFIEHYSQASSLNPRTYDENPLLPLPPKTFPNKPPSYLYVATPLVFGGYQHSPQPSQLLQEDQTSPLEAILQKKLFFTQLSFGEPYVFHWSQQRESLDKLFPRDYETFLLFLQQQTLEQEKHQKSPEKEKKGKTMAYAGFPPDWSFSFQHHVLEFFADNDPGEQKIIALGGCYDEHHPHMVYEAYGFVDHEGYFREEAPWGALPPPLQQILPSYSLKAYGQGRYKKKLQSSSVPQGFSCTLSLGGEDQDRYQNILYESVDVQRLWKEEITQHPWCFFLLRRRI